MLLAGCASDQPHQTADMRQFGYTYDLMTPLPASPIAARVDSGTTYVETRGAADSSVGGIRVASSSGPQSDLTSSVVLDSAGAAVRVGGTPAVATNAVLDSNIVVDRDRPTTVITDPSPVVVGGTLNPNQLANPAVSGNSVNAPLSLPAPSTVIVEPAGAAPSANTNASRTGTTVIDAPSSPGLATNPVSILRTPPATPVPPTVITEPAGSQPRTAAPLAPTPNFSPSANPQTPAPTPGLNNAPVPGDSPAPTPDFSATAIPAGNSLTNPAVPFPNFTIPRTVPSAIPSVPTSPQSPPVGNSPLTVGGDSGGGGVVMPPGSGGTSNRLIRGAIRNNGGTPASQSQQTAPAPQTPAVQNPPAASGSGASAPASPSAR